MSKSGDGMYRFKLPKDWLLVLGLVIVVYLIINLVLPRFSNGFFTTYIIQPVIWLLLAYFIRRLPKYRGIGKSSVRGLLIKLAAGTAVFQVYLALVAGFFEKFGWNPNSFTPKGIIINLIFVAAGLIGMEYSRAWLINRLAKKPVILVPAVVALVYTVFCLPLNSISRFGGTLEDITKFTGSTLFPQFVENLFASFLALWGGALPALAYRGVLQGFNWFCPVLPDLNWAMKALVGTAVPVVGLVIVQQVCLAKSFPGKYRRESGKGLTGAVIVSAVMVVLIWFSIGVFPVRPTVIISGSMRPVMEVGDVAIVGRANTKVLKVGDIIQFRQEEKSIPTVHRIIESYEENNKLIYITKGDANRISDSDPVYSEQVVGKVIFVVPKAGWATIAVKKLFA